jgi:hypothetical protein
MSDKLNCRIDQNTSDLSILFARAVLRAAVRPTEVVSQRRAIRPTWARFAEVAPVGVPKMMGCWDSEKTIEILG